MPSKNHKPSLKLGQKLWQIGLALISKSFTKYFVSTCFTATEQKRRNSKLFAHPPRVLAKIPKYEAKWKFAPDYRISDNIPTEKARNILIATSWRFGSTFLGDLLNHYPGTFYSFEPLHYLDHIVSSIIIISTWE